MNVVQRVARNTLALFISSVISRVLGLFYIMYTARYLGVEGFGILSFSLAFAGIFSILTDFGLGPLTVREVARDESLAKKYLVNISLIKVILGIATFGLIALIINLLGYPEQVIKVVYLIALSVIFTAFIQMFNSVFQAFEKMEYISLGQILNSFLMLSGVIIAVKSGFTIIGFALLYFIVSIILLGYSFVVLRWKFTNLLFISVTKILEIDWNFWKSTIKKSLPFFLSAVVGVIAFRIDIVMLSIMKGNMVVGWYSAAYRIMEVLMFIPVSLVGAIYPVLSNYHVSSQESLKRAYLRIFKYLFIISLPLAVGITLLAGKIILIIYQNSFAQSVIALQVLIWTIPAIFLTFMYGTILASIDKQFLALKINFLCMLLNIVANLILIPKYSFIGASVATVITSLLSLILCFKVISKFICRIAIYRYITKPVIASITMGLFILFLPKMNLFFIIFVSIVVYFGVLILLRIFSKEDYNLFKEIIKQDEMKQ